MQRQPPPHEKTLESLPEGKFDNGAVYTLKHAIERLNAAWDIYGAREEERQRNVQEQEEAATALKTRLLEISPIVCPSNETSIFVMLTTAVPTSDEDNPVDTLLSYSLVRQSALVTGDGNNNNDNVAEMNSEFTSDSNTTPTPANIGNYGFRTPIDPPAAVRRQRINQRVVVYLQQTPSNGRIRRRAAYRHP